jgi:hypothetical protein
MTESELEARIAALEAAIATRTSMRRSYRCPECGGTKLLHFQTVADQGRNQIHELSLQKKIGLWSGMAAGHLEAFACRSCRLVEWYASDLDKVEVDGVTVVELDGTQPPRQPTGPYR